MLKSMNVLKAAYQECCSDCCPDPSSIQFAARVSSFDQIVGVHEVHNNRMKGILNDVSKLVRSSMGYSLAQLLYSVCDTAKADDFAKNVIPADKFKEIKDNIKTYEETRPEGHNFKLLSNSPKWSNLIQSLIAYNQPDADLQSHPLNKAFNDRGTSKMKDYELVVSIDPHRIVGMSAFGKFTSCQDWIEKPEGVGYHDYTHQSWANMTDETVGIMYIRKVDAEEPTEDDPNVQDMYARSLLRIAELPNGCKVLYIHRLYGISPYTQYLEDSISQFVKTLPENWFAIHLYKHSKSEYKTGKNKYGKEYSGLSDFRAFKTSCGVESGECRCDCEDCSGEGSRECGCCEGSGYVTTYDRNDNEYENECRECEGSGNAECDECNGDGYIMKDGETVYPYNDHSEWVAMRYNGVTFQVPNWILNWDVKPAYEPEIINPTMDGNVVCLWNQNKIPVGTRVQVRTDLEVGKSYPMYHNTQISDCVVMEMEQFAGQWATIIRNSGDKYKIDLDNNLYNGLNWTDGMFNVVYRTQPRELRIGDRVKVRDDLAQLTTCGGITVFGGHSIYAGQWLTIVEVNEFVNGFKASANGLWFSKEMFDLTQMEVAQHA